MSLPQLDSVKWHLRKVSEQLRDAGENSGLPTPCCCACACPFARSIKAGRRLLKQRGLVVTNLTVPLGPHGSLGVMQRTGPKKGQYGLPMVAAAQVAAAMGVAKRTVISKLKSEDLKNRGKLHQEVGGCKKVAWLLRAASARAVCQSACFCMVLHSIIGLAACCSSTALLSGQ